LFHNHAKLNLTIKNSFPVQTVVKEKKDE